MANGLLHGTFEYFQSYHEMVWMGIHEGNGIVIQSTSSQLTTWEHMRRMERGMEWGRLALASPSPTPSTACHQISLQGQGAAPPSEQQADLWDSP